MKAKTKKLNGPIRMSAADIAALSPAVRARLFTFDGTTKHASDWCRIAGISWPAVLKRLAKGISDREAFFGEKAKQDREITLSNETKRLSEWARIAGVSMTTASRRIERGWSNHDAFFKVPSRLKHGYTSGQQTSLKLGYTRKDGSFIPKEYRAWTNLKARSLNPNNASYPRYGGRGIKVCPEWLESFEAFLSDMGPAPSAEHSVDRIDSDGDYSPHNCRWALSDVQRANQTAKRQPRCDAQLLEVHGVVKNLKEWAEETGLTKSTIRHRIHRGRTPEQAVAK